MLQPFGGQTKLAWLSRVVAILALALSVGFALLGTVRAQDSPFDVEIHSLEPAAPECIVLSARSFVDRTLTVTGKNLSGLGGRRLQFMDSVTGFRTIHFGSEVRWISDSERRVDMRSIRRFFPEHDRAVYRVRVTDAKYLPISDWSAQEVILVQAEEDCPPPEAAPFPQAAPPRGVPGDLWADVIIGKPDFSVITPNQVVPFKVFNPGGVVVDRSVSPGRAYIWDGGNSRILGVDLAKCYDGPSPCRAEVVIGQPPGYGHSACNGDSGVQGFPNRPLASAETLCGLPEVSESPGEQPSFVNMAVDSQGNLYVPDSYNNRVLYYENPFENDSVADEVWGQAEFTGVMCNRGKFYVPAADTLCFYSSFTFERGPTGIGWPTAGLAVDPEGNLWVADVGNNRVLRFSADRSTGLPSKNADLVIGHSDFREMEFDADDLGLDSLWAPGAVRLDEQGRLYVADTYNGRVLAFDPPFESGMAASFLFGSDFVNPTSLATDLDGDGLWVNDLAGKTVALWDRDGERIIETIESRYQPTGGVAIDAAGGLVVCSHSQRKTSEDSHATPVSVKASGMTYAFSILRVAPTLRT